MALGNLRKRKSVISASSKVKPASPASKRGKSTLGVAKSVLSASNKGKPSSPASKRGKSILRVSKKGKSVLKKRQHKAASPCKSVSCSLESRVCILFSKLIDSGTVLDHEAVFYIRKRNQSVMKEGRMTRDGVLCCCCRKLFGLSKFEAHAGSALHRPSANMFLRDGRSLMECLHPAEGKVESCSRQSSSKRKTQSDDRNDNICQICGDGGQLMLCDSCPSAFHYNCLHLDEIPDGDWHCTRCRCGSCGLGKGLAKEESGSVMLSCMQCQVPYHQSCVSRPGDGSEGPWFCTRKCHNVFERLRKLVGRVFAIDNIMSWMLLKSSEEESDASAKERLSEAQKMLQQCFDPIIDQETGVDVLSQLVYNRTSDVKRLDCSGFYTMLLMKGDHLVSVATIRTRGKVLAEMPFIATGYEFRQQGMCKVLMQAIEAMLWGVGLYKLVIPSINEVVETWTGSFGFKPMSLEDRKQFSGTNFLSFPDTTLLSKSLLGPGARRRLQAALEVREVQGRSVIEVKDQMVESPKASLSRSQPIVCH